MPEENETFFQGHNGARFRSTGCGDVVIGAGRGALVSEAPRKPGKPGTDSTLGASALWGGKLQRQTKKGHGNTKHAKHAGV